MGRTLAEARTSLGVAEGRLESHKNDCLQCRVARQAARRCDEFRAIQAEIKQLRFEIRTWFTPQPDDPSLFDLG